MTNMEKIRHNMKVWADIKNHTYSNNHINKVHNLIDKLEDDKIMEIHEEMCKSSIISDAPKFLELFKKCV